MAAAAAASAAAALARQVTRLSHGGRTASFLVPGDTEALRRVVCSEFGLDAERVELALTARIEVDEKSEDVVVPFQVECLRSLVGLPLSLRVRELRASPLPPPLPAQTQTQTQPQPQASTSTTQRSHGAPIAPQPQRSGGATVSAGSRVGAPFGVDPTAASASPPAASEALSVDGLKPNHVVALYDYAGKSSVELSFKQFDEIRVVAQYNEGWWKGERYDLDEHGDEVNLVSGFFPANYVLGLERVHLEAGDDPMQDSEYFESYSSLVIHHQMLHDDARTAGYRRAVENLAPVVRGKVVLDVGCGSGVLSVFCAQAGAAHVIGVDASDIIRRAAAKVVRENGLQDRITLVKGKIEQVELPRERAPDGRVDVIISEWMGTFLVCESMIESVLAARERFLRPGGVMMPSDATLYLAPLCCDTLYRERIEFFREVHGVKMASLIPDAKRTFFQKPVYDRLIEPGDVIAAPEPILSLDMSAAQPAALEHSACDFAFRVTRAANFHGFGAWFDVDFKAPGCAPLRLSTAPECKGTHWRQVIFVVGDPLPVAEGAVIRGSIVIKRNAFWRRHFDTTITFFTEAAGGEVREHVSTFEMWR